MSARPPQLIGESPAFHRLMDQISDLAVLNRPITITGARGTGKSLLAARLHFLSPRWEQSFLSFDCAAIYKDSHISQLFGDDNMDGVIRSADGGTLLIDHIDYLGPSAQQRLLHMIETGDVWPDDGEDPVKVNTRIIVTTRNNLPALAAQGLFDFDLLDRLAFGHIHVPSLMARKADILPLVQYFGRHMATELGANSFPGFTPEAILEMEDQEWAGNIGELKTAVERSTAESFLADESLSQPIARVLYNPLKEANDLGLPLHIPPSLQAQAVHLIGPPPAAVADIPTPPSPPTAQNSNGSDINTTDSPEGAPQGFYERISVFERRLIDEALTIGQGHQGKAAKHLGMTYHAFRGLLRKHGLKK